MPRVVDLHLAVAGTEQPERAGRDAVNPAQVQADEPPGR
jgi:hypothetical protein